MYAEAKVAERISLAEDELKVKLEYHSLDEVIRFEKYLQENSMYVLDDHGVPESLRNLTDFARRWMINEQALCLCDAAYFLTRYGWLKDQNNVVFRFKFRVAQRILFEIIASLELDDAAIEIMILKARQLGMSTLVELLMVHRIALGYGINAVIGSADEAMTWKMGDMFRFAYDNLPIWLRPTHTRRVESARGLIEFGTLSTSVTFQHGAQKQGIGTGTTPTLYHLSEVAHYAVDRIEVLIEQGLWKAVHASPNVLGILESTGRGDVGWWADRWRYSKDNWATRQARMCPLFLPWFCGIDLYPTETWIRTHPIPEAWRPNEDTAEHVAKCELYVQSEEILRRHLLEEQQRGTIAWNQPSPDGRWRMPHEQQWWWECVYREAKENGTTATHFQELAADDVEALQRSGGEPVFGNQTIVEIDRRRQREYHCWGLTGQSIETVHEPTADYIDYKADRKIVRYRSPKGEVYRWELIPMAFGNYPGCQHPPLDETARDSPMGLLIEYEEPRPGVSYSIGVDTSEGGGADSSAISVWALGWDTIPDRQVAEFASPYVSHTEAFSFVLAVAAYYGQHMRLGETKWKEPYVAIEQVAAVGDTCQMQMNRMGYTNFHRMIRYDTKSLGRQKRITNKRGWFTYTWSRPILLGHFVHWVQNGWAEVQSPWLIDEMKHFEVNTTASGKVKWEHEDEYHDDRIFAAAMAIFCPHDMDRMDQRSKKRPAQDPYEREIDVGDYLGIVIPAAALRDSAVLSLDDVINNRWRSPK